MKERVAILGAGSLGTIIGAIASQKGADCVLVDANAEHVKALNKNGATVTGKMDLKNISVKAITPNEMEGIYDTVILLTKQTANKVVLNNLLPYINENSVVATLQNGIPEESVAAIVGRERTVGGAVGWGAGWAGPGISELYTDQKFMIIEIGNMHNEVDEKLQRVENFLKLAGGVTINTNLVGFRWAKLLMNATMSGMSAALGCTFGDVLDDDKAVKCAATIAKELIKTARKKGITLEEIVPGKDFYTLEFEGEKELNTAIEFMRDVWSVHRPQKASMLQDMEKGIPCEISYINGLVCDTGAEQGVPTPINQVVVDIVKAFEGGEPFPTMANLAKFKI
ncbi:MAG: 2-dehydropantoate 2-reductase [Defluviitaleaceae bacterium]|nr:2-dehydropantoate 2-reductase [Defluviitaleaceae bacterium]